MIAQLREHVENYGAETVARRIAAGVQNGDLPPERFSLRYLWEGFIGDVETTLPLAMRGGLHGGLLEVVRSQAFTVVTQAVLFSKVLDAYNQRGGILDQLVTTMPSNLRTEKIVGFGAMNGPLDVPEGEEYPGTGFTDHATEAPEPPKRGRAIEITMETIKFDRSGQVLARAGAYGAKLRLDREKRGLNTIQDITAYKAYYPIIAGSATQTALYRSSAGSNGWVDSAVNLKASNALVDYTDIENAWLLYKDMKDTAGDEILVMPNVLLVPMALLARAANIISAVSFEQRTDKEGEAPDVAQFARSTISKNAPIAAMGLSGITILTSPYLDAQSATTWYLGDFRAQFVDHEILPIQVIEVAGDPRKDIVTQFIGRYKSAVTAPDDKFVIKNTA